jgi:hypothetical protein
MSHSNGAGDSKLLVITDDQSFGDAIVDTIAELNVAASAERVEPPTDGVTAESPDAVPGLSSTPNYLTQCLSSSVSVQRFSSRSWW